MGPLVTTLVQGLIMLVIAAFALGVGGLLTRLSARPATVALAAIGLLTLLLASGFWLAIRRAFDRIETDAEAVATVLTAVVFGVWAIGLAVGFAVAGRRSPGR